MLFEWIILILIMLVCGALFMFILSLFVGNIIDQIVQLKRQGLLSDETVENEGRVKMDMNKLRQNLRKRVHKRTKWDKHVSILDEVGGDSVLLWHYNDNKAEVRSKDVNLLLALKECIEMYLEETEGES